MKSYVLAICLILPSMAMAANTADLSWDYTSNGTWNDNPSFQVYQGLSGQPKTLAATTSAKAITINSGLSLGNTYCWEVSVKSTVSGLESAHTAEVCKSFPYSVPLPPTNLQVN